jgi:cytochrome c peroxidase
MKPQNPFIIPTLCLLASGGLMAADIPLSPLQELGKQLFFDEHLSNPAGQSCASCHSPDAAFTDPRRAAPTSAGVLPGRFGSRNSPTAMYAAFSPPFHLDPLSLNYQGGLFLDGRAMTLEEQAQGPFLNPLEMANPEQPTAPTALV